MSSGTAVNSMVSTLATTNFVAITSRRRTGVASRWMMLPSSISAPSTLVPMTSAVSGNSTEKPKSPRTRSGHSVPGDRPARSTKVSTMRITGAMANSRARLRPSVARSVIMATVGLRGIRGCSNQVTEDAFQRLVGRLQFAQPDALGAGKDRDLPGERAVVGGADGKALAGELDRGHVGPPHQRRRQPPVIGTAQAEHVRPARHQPPDLPEVPGGGQPPGDHHLNGARDPLDLF